MQISFDPPLQTVTSVHIHRLEQPGENEPATLVFSATLSEQEHVQLKEQGSQIQIWSNLPSQEREAGEWGPESFVLEEQVFQDVDRMVSNDALRIAPIHLGDKNRQEGVSSAVLKARFLIPTSLKPEQSFQYTYRIVYPDGGISWQGEGEASNGTIRLVSKIVPLIEDLEDGWGETGDGARVLSVDWQEQNKSLALGKFSGLLNWGGWVMTDAGPRSFELPSRPPPRSNFMILLPSHAHHKYIDRQDTLLQYMLHTSPGSSIITCSEGELTLERGNHSESNGPQHQVYIRPLNLELLTNLFKLAEQIISPEMSEKARVILAQTSPDFVAFLTQGSPAVHRVDIMPLTSRTMHTTIQFDKKSISEILDGHSAVCAVSPEAGSGSVIKLDTGFDPEESEFKVLVPPEGGTFLLSLLFSPSPVEDRPESVSTWSIAPLSFLIRSQSQRRVRFGTISKHPPRPNGTLTEGSTLFPPDSGTMMASMAYIALLITVLLSYIAPSTSATLRSHLPSGPNGQVSVQDAKPGSANGMEIDSVSEDDSESLEEENSEGAMMGSSTNVISFDLSKVPVTEPCRFALQCPQEKIRELIFTLDKEEIELPLTKLDTGKDLWLMEVKDREGRSKLRVQNRG